MRYLILIYGNEAAWNDVSPERAGEIMGAYTAYTQKLKAAGVHIAGDELQPVATGKSIRGQGGTKVIDGPYVDTKEQLGGYYLIEAPNDAEALKWAKQCPTPMHGGGMELRPYSGALSLMFEAAIAERVARESYGRLLALLAARTCDVATAEDALADAFAAALSVWPKTGAPERPEAWLFAAAKRKLIDASRRARTALDAQAALVLAAAEVEEEVARAETPDRRLGLLFACAHPDIEPAARTPLMLQTVLGFSAEQIAAAFLVAPASMSQRLVRAKRRIREARIGFEVPGAEAWPQRLDAVLDAVYAAYSEGWSDAEGSDPSRAALAEEGVWLGRVLAQQLPGEPEVLGLLALMLHLEARRPARSAQGRFIPLDEQNVTLWRADLYEEGETLLRRAAYGGHIGRFQLEAAIQSAHAARRCLGKNNWDAIVSLYGALSELTGSPVAELNRVAALARRDGAEAGLAALDALPSPELKSYQPFWALQADLLAKLNRHDDARAAYDEAIARERDAAVIRFLSERRASIARPVKVRK